MVDRAELGIDGDCGFALLGDDLQSGIAEFVKIETAAPKGTSEYESAAKRAITKAFINLRDRVGGPLSYRIGQSHPSYLP